MIWNKITIKTTNEAADIVASVLFDNGIIGAEINDSMEISEEDLKKMYVDIPEKIINTGIAYVSFYYENENINIDTIKNDILSYKDFIDVGELSFIKTKVDDKDIFTKWRDNFKRIEFDNIHIIPSWEKENNGDKNSLNIFINPGSAFGTGQHATTKLCIKSIKNIIDNKKLTVKNSSFLDIGCGSGILSIVGKKLGFNDVLAIDIDEKVKENLDKNIEINNIHIDYDFGDIISDYSFRRKILFKKYDLIVANILAPVIIELLNNVRIFDFISDDGYFICSGILKEKEKEVLSEIINVNNLKVIDIYEENDWVCILSKKI